MEAEDVYAGTVEVEADMHEKPVKVVGRHLADVGL